MTPICSNSVESTVQRLLPGPKRLALVAGAGLGGGGGKPGPNLCRSNPDAAHKRAATRRGALPEPQPRPGAPRDSNVTASAPKSSSWKTARPVNKFRHQIRGSDQHKLTAASDRDPVGVRTISAAGFRVSWKIPAIEAGRTAGPGFPHYFSHAQCQKRGARHEHSNCSQKLICLR